MTDFWTALDRLDIILTIAGITGLWPIFVWLGDKMPKYIGSLIGVPQRSNPEKGTLGGFQRWGMGCGCSFIGTILFGVTLGYVGSLMTNLNIPDYSIALYGLCLPSFLPGLLGFILGILIKKRLSVSGR